MKRYLYDKEFILKSEIRVRPIDPYPRRSTTVRPPKTRGTEVAAWRGDTWEVLPERPEPPVAVADSLDAEAFHLALHRAGYLDAAEAHFLDRPTRAIRWQRRAEFKRSSKLVGDMQGALALTDEQMDDLFTVRADD